MRTTMIHRTSRAVGAALLATIAVAGCSTEDQNTDKTTTTEQSQSPSASPSETTQSSESPTADAAENAAVKLSVKDGKWSNTNMRMDLKAGAPLTLTIDADAPGALHVHSTPEQEFDFEAGTHDYELTIDQPGVVEVEDHDSGEVVLQLAVK